MKTREPASARGPVPADWTAELKPYASHMFRAPIDLHLDGNEGQAPFEGLQEVVRRYPSAAELEALLAQRLGVGADQVLVTAGADEALDRICRTFLAPGRQCILPRPTFVMLPHYVRLAGGTAIPVDWEEGEFPVDAVLAARTPNVGVVAMVSPNNPTGAAATKQDLERISAEFPEALVLLDHAYAEFADEDLSATALELFNVLLVRTLSKAWGLAGLRVGFVAGPPRFVKWLRAAGGPYAVSGISLALAKECLRSDEGRMRTFVARVREERDALRDDLRALGVPAPRSQANFVWSRAPNAAFLRDALAAFGIAVRSFQEDSASLRITCPGSLESFERLRRALRVVLAPQALLLDLDGVLADVSRSYRQCILETALTFGVKLDREDVSREKCKGSSNNDWELTQRLLLERGVQADRSEVVRRFEAIYQGTTQRSGLRAQERLLVERDLLKHLAARFPLAIVTGRPRSDAIRFLREQKIEGCFSALVTMEDGPAKPDPAPVRVALQRLRIERAWMIGDTPDEMHAARAAGVLPLGVVAPLEPNDATRCTLEQAGAARVLSSLAALRELLP